MGSEQLKMKERAKQKYKQTNIIRIIQTNEQTERKFAR